MILVFENKEANIQKFGNFKMRIGKEGREHKRSKTITERELLVRAEPNI